MFLTCDPLLSWENKSILDREKDYSKRMISEMLHINSCKNTLNKKEYTQFSNRIYKNVL